MSIKMESIMKYLKEAAVELDWSAEFDDKVHEYCFSKYSPAGQEFIIDISAETVSEFIEKLNSYVENFDCSSETYAWLDSSGHGTNGAPYDMKDLYEDMESCLEMAKELLVALSEKADSIWYCPNGCEINHVLICGGNLSESKSNIYFQAQLDGTYTNLLEDGTLGVPSDCYDHADGGCCQEPICPDCRTECTKG